MTKFKTPTKKQIDKYVKEYVGYLLELVDSLEENASKLDTVNEKEKVLFFQLAGFGYNVFYKIIGIKNFLKEFFNYEMEIDVKYNEYMKVTKEPFYLKGKELIMLGQDGSEQKISDFIKVLKSLKEKDTSKTNGKK